MTTLGRRVRVAALALALTAVAPAAPAMAQYSTPDSARLETGDVARFFAVLAALPEATTRRDSARVVFEQYYYLGSDGLLDFVERRIGSAFQLADKIADRPLYYAHLPSSLAGLDAATPRLRGYFADFETLWPDAVFADVYFVVGRMNSGGTTSADKLLIGAEMYGRDSAAPTGELNDWETRVLRDTSQLEAVVVHELMHVNQPTPGEGFQPTLLYLALREGGADFVAELVTGRNINDHVHAWANPREKEVWEEFQVVMESGDAGGWFGSNRDPARPPDLGYYVGYRIARALYDRTPDKRQAIGRILRVTDAAALLAESGYAP